MSAAGPELDLLSSIESGAAPRRILEFAARGFVPLPPGDLVRAICSILATRDPELTELAEETFKTFDWTVMKEAVSHPNVRAEQLEEIAHRTTAAEVLEPLIRHKNTADDTLAWLAERITPWLQDVLVTNQVRLLAAPVIVERLFENPQLSTDIRRRADEFLEEFFLKKVREEDAKRAARAELAAAGAELEDLPAPAFEEEEPDIPEGKAAELAAKVEEAVEKGEANLTKLANLTVAQRVLIAYRGNREERLFLVRDNNRLVAMAALRSPKTRESDVEVIANMKSVSEDVLRVIGTRRMWLRKYPILSALVRNPRAPLDVTLPLMSRVSQKDIRLLAKDRNVPEAVRNTARRTASRYET